MAGKQSRGLDEGYGKVVEGLPDIIPVKSPKNIGDLTVKIDVDVSEALTGLKAVAREAKAAQKALRELESTAQRLKVHMDDNAAEYYVDIQRATTKALSEELAKREGVTEHNIDERGDRSWVNVHSRSENTSSIGTVLSVEAPARIIVIKE